MKQSLDSMRNGKTTIEDVPNPKVHPGSSSTRGIFPGISRNGKDAGRFRE